MTTDARLMILVRACGAPNPAKNEYGKLAFILSALILAALFNMCFVYGCWYFNAKSVLEVIVFIIGLIVLRRDTLRSSALMGTISIVLAVLLDMVIPFHFG